MNCLGEVRISPFKLGLVLVAVGMTWISLVFNEAEKTHGSTLLKQSSSFEMRSEFSGTGIAFYKIYMPEFSGEEVFVQILDTRNNVVQEQMVQTKMSVGYFGPDTDGTHTVKITNVSDDQIILQVEFGSTNSPNMFFPGILILVGAVIMMMAAYVMIKNYSMEQPDENIS